jgi:DNA modification methylase
MNRIEFGDCIEIMRSWPANIVQTCVTSPPYFGLRDYRHAGQIGLEPTPDEYVAKMVDVFREVRRVLRDDGTLWLNLGDSYASPTKGSGGAGKSTLGPNKDLQNIRFQKMEPRRFECGLAPKHLIGIPWRVAFALQAAGWYLRQDIIWQKPNPMPESVTDRCTKAHEYIFMLTKSSRYYYDNEAVKEPAVKGAARSSFTKSKTAEHQLGRASTTPRKQDGHGVRHAGFNDRYDFDNPSETRNRRSVWTVSTKPYKGAHFATFPPDLIEPCVLAGSRPGDIVLDPFMGSGTTAGVAMKHGRQYLGCELNTEYGALQAARIATIVPNSDMWF